jgi:hypothetical protein
MATSQTYDIPVIDTAIKKIPHVSQVRFHHPGNLRIFEGGWFLQKFPDWFLNKNKRPSQGRYTFTTWNYFTKDSKLEPSGLLGPMKLLIETQL